MKVWTVKWVQCLVEFVGEGRINGGMKVRQYGSYASYTYFFKWSDEGFMGGDSGSDLINVQLKAIWNC
jgi:hypothetical protein